MILSSPVLPATAPPPAPPPLLARTTVTLALRDILHISRRDSRGLFGLRHRDLLLFLQIRHHGGADRNHLAGGNRHPCCGLEFLDLEIRADHARIGFQPHRHAIARLDLRQMLALLVDDEIHHRRRRAHQHFARLSARAFFLDLAQHRQAHAVIRPDQPGAMAMRARLCRRFQHPRTQPLTRHLQQPKA